MSALRRDWDELARLDPGWAVLTDENRRFGGWPVDELLASGEEEVSGLLGYLDQLGLPSAGRAALDYGCGIGRLTGPLAERFERVVGIDISPVMLARARDLSQGRANVEFVEADGPEGLVPGGFDLIYSNLVLQHSESAGAAIAQVASLARALAPGGALVVQMPVRIPLRRRIQARRRAYRALRLAGVPAELLYRRLRLNPMRMRALPMEVVIDAVEGEGARVVRADRESWPDGVESITYFATREE